MLSMMPGHKKDTIGPLAQLQHAPRDEMEDSRNIEMGVRNTAFESVVGFMNTSCLQCDECHCKELA